MPVMVRNSSANYYLSKWIAENTAGARPGVDYQGNPDLYYPYMGPYNWSFPVSANIQWPPHVKVVDSEWEAANYINNTKNAVGFLDSNYGLNYSDARGFGLKSWDGKPIVLLEGALVNKAYNNLTSQAGNFDTKTTLVSNRKLYTIPITTNYTAWKDYSVSLTNRQGWRSYPLSYMVVAYTYQDLRFLGNNRGAMLKQLLAYFQTDKARTLPKKYYARTLTDDLRNTSIWGANNLTADHHTKIWSETTLPDTFLF
jgi:hypothetical protein